uniref:RRM domain-containing protein n=1 Tax=Anopheles christyi TaxID=43041 RepID=A0A182JS21_9DIPT
MIQTIQDVNDCVPLYLPHSLYLKPLAKFNISVALPASITGKTISNYDVMEKMRQMILPDKFSLLKVSKSTVGFIRFEGELEDKGKLKTVLSRLDGRPLRLTGFEESVKVRASEAKDEFPTRHDWDSFFRDARNMDEMKAGERPDTIHFSNMPIKWFCPRHAENDDGAKPSESIFKRIFEKFGEVRAVDIPICDPYRPQMKAHMSGMKKFSFDQEMYFEGYVQFSEYVGFVKAMDEFRGMKLVRKEGERNLAVTIAVDFDRTKHLSDATVKKRQIVRDRLIAVDREKEELEKKRLAEEEARKEQERKKQEDLRQAEIEKQLEREQKRKEKHLQKLRQKESEEINQKIRLEEKKLLEAQRKLESIRLLDALFDRMKLKQSLEKGKRKSIASSDGEGNDTMSTSSIKDRQKKASKLKATQEKELAKMRLRLKQAKDGSVLKKVLSTGLGVKVERSRSPSINTISSDDGILSDTPKTKKKRKSQTNSSKKSDGSGSSSSEGSGEEELLSGDEKGKREEDPPIQPQYPAQPMPYDRGVGYGHPMVPTAGYPPGSMYPGMEWASMSYPYTTTAQWRIGEHIARQPEDLGIPVADQEVECLVDAVADIVAGEDTITTAGEEDVAEMITIMTGGHTHDLDPGRVRVLDIVAGPVAVEAVVRAREAVVVEVAEEAEAVDHTRVPAHDHGRNHGLSPVLPNPIIVVVVRNLDPDRTVTAERTRSRSRSRSDEQAKKLAVQMSKPMSKNLVSTIRGATPPSRSRSRSRGHSRSKSRSRSHSRSRSNYKHRSSRRHRSSRSRHNGSERERSKPPKEPPEPIEPMVVGPIGPRSPPEPAPEMLHAQDGEDGEEMVGGPPPAEPNGISIGGNAIDDDEEPSMVSESFKKHRIIVRTDTLGTKTTKEIEEEVRERLLRQQMERELEKRKDRELEKRKERELEKRKERELQKRKEAEEDDMEDEEEEEEEEEESDVEQQHRQRQQQQKQHAAAKASDRRVRNHAKPYEPSLHGNGQKRKDEIHRSRSEKMPERNDKRQRTKLPDGGRSNGKKNVRRESSSSSDSEDDNEEEDEEEEEEETSGSSSGEEVIDHRRRRTADRPRIKSPPESPRERRRRRFAEEPSVDRRHAKEIGGNSDGRHAAVEEKRGRVPLRQPSGRTSRGRSREDRHRSGSRPVERESSSRQRRSPSGARGRHVQQLRQRSRSRDHHRKSSHARPEEHRNAGNSGDEATVRRRGEVTVGSRHHGGYRGSRRS